MQPLLDSLDAATLFTNGERAMTNHDKDLLACCKVEMRALILGAVVSRPTTDFARYDRVIDWGGKLYRADQICLVRRFQLRGSGAASPDPGQLPVLHGAGDRCSARLHRAVGSALLVRAGGLRWASTSIDPVHACAEQSAEQVLDGCRLLVVKCFESLRFSCSG